MGDRAGVVRASTEPLGNCRLLMLAMATTWRFDRDDQLPHGRRLGDEWLVQLRADLSCR